jgi:hypothetical protein
MFEDEREKLIKSLMDVFTRTEYNQMRNLSQYSIRKLDGEITKKKVLNIAIVMKM